MAINKQLVVGLLFLLGLAVPAFGEDKVFYCVEDKGAGFKYFEKQGAYDYAGFKPLKFTMKYEPENNALAISLPELGLQYFLCRLPYSDTSALSCIGNFNMFNWDQTTGRFVLARGYGYIMGEGDSVSVSMGMCTNFD